MGPPTARGLHAPKPRVSAHPLSPRITPYHPVSPGPPEDRPPRITRPCLLCTPPCAPLALPHIAHVAIAMLSLSHAVSTPQVRILFAIPVGIYTIAVQWDQLLARGLPLWRCSLFAGFFCVGAILNMMWGHKLFMGALKILTAKSA